MGSEPGVPAPREIVLTDEFRQALALLAGGKHLFLTGKAGTGKSTLIRRFMADTDRNVVVVAPTGIAALNVDGYTIHRLFGFRTTTTLHDVRGGGYRPGRFTKTLASLDTLIIDEASMVRADVFDMLVSALERFGPAPGQPFGGVQIVLVGDLYQLPPVVTDGEAAFFSTTYETPYFFSANSFRRDDFPTVALTTVFRQLGDDRMTAILNEIREGVLLGHAQEQLNGRTDPEFVPPEDEFWLTLAPTNRLVSARNRQQLDRLPGSEVVHRARVSGDLSLFDPPADDVLRFKAGAQIMMLNNDQGGRWVNGTIGRVVGVDESRGGLVVEVEFPDGECEEVTPYTWEATRPVVDGGALRREVIGTFTQLPCKLAWAITIHKSQGQTLDRLIVDLTGGMFSTGQLYVALSRCTSMNGLVLKRPVLPKDLKVDRRIARFLRSAVRDDRARRYCAIATLTVGEEGRMSRPRPVEFAVAFDDGTAVSTVVNPQRDLADARQAYGITTSDVLLAPTLREAWAVIAPMLAGCTPVGSRDRRDAGADRLRVEAARIRDGNAVGNRGVWAIQWGFDGAGAGARSVGGACPVGCRRWGCVGVRRPGTGRIAVGSAGQPRSRGADAGGRPPARAVGVAAREPGCQRDRVARDDGGGSATVRRDGVDRGGAAVGGRPVMCGGVACGADRRGGGTAARGGQAARRRHRLWRLRIGTARYRRGPGSRCTDLFHGDGAGCRGTGR